MTAPDRAVRISNMLTPDKRMACGGVYGPDSTNFGVFNYTFKADAVNQVWVKEPVTNEAPFAYRLWNLGSSNSGNKLYLTRFTKSVDSDTYCKAAVSLDPDRQIWYIE